MRDAASCDSLLATELADALARRGIPFREAHEIVGRRVAEAGKRGVGLGDLPVSREITRRDLAALDLDRALAKRNVFGGTSPRRVAQASRAALARVASARRLK
jgi:argininosuccinate lyase